MISHQRKINVRTAIQISTTWSTRACFKGETTITYVIACTCASNASNVDRRCQNLEGWKFCRGIRAPFRPHSWTWLQKERSAFYCSW